MTKKFTGSDHYKHFKSVTVNDVDGKPVTIQPEPIYLTAQMGFMEGSILKYAARLHVYRNDPNKVIEHCNKIINCAERIKYDALKQMVQPEPETTSYPNKDVTSPKDCYEYFDIGPRCLDFFEIDDCENCLIREYCESEDEYPRLCGSIRGDQIEIKKFRKWLQKKYGYSEQKAELKPIYIQKKKGKRTTRTP